MREQSLIRPLRWAWTKYQSECPSLVRSSPNFRTWQNPTTAVAAPPLRAVTTAAATVLLSRATPSSPTLMPPTHPPLCALALAAASIRELADSPGPGGGEGSRTRSRTGGPVITEPPTPTPSPVITDTRSTSRMAARTPSSSHTPVDGSAASQDTNEPPSEESNDSSDDVSDDGESTPTASGNEQENGLDSEATQDQMPKQKKARKARRPNQLTDETFVITRVDGRGVPASPVKFSKGYSNAIGCIVRETVKITCTNLRSKEHENLRQRLLNKLFNRYIR
ncbi:mucin-1-like [Lolium rigidum]|uniref:mucin-1-like n=1 Tax=Lolium rigidum TaxID=89674 RepID=UPI001F5D58CC|nr:mucin-1-like [Lolium rigidum]